jgi:hypothetical protein
LMTGRVPGNTLHAYTQFRPLALVRMFSPRLRQASSPLLKIHASRISLARDFALSNF